MTANAPAAPPPELVTVELTLMTPPGTPVSGTLRAAISRSGPILMERMKRLFVLRTLAFDLARVGEGEQVVGAAGRVRRDGDRCGRRHGCARRQGSDRQIGQACIGGLEQAVRRQIQRGRRRFGGASALVAGRDRQRERSAGARGRRRLNRGDDRGLPARAVWPRLRSNRRSRPASSRPRPRSSRSCR